MVKGLNDLDRKLLNHEEKVKPIAYRFMMDMRKK